MPERLPCEQESLAFHQGSARCQTHPPRAGQREEDATHASLRITWHSPERSHVPDSSPTVRHIYNLNLLWPSGQLGKGRRCEDGMYCYQSKTQRGRKQLLLLPCCALKHKLLDIWSYWSTGNKKAEQKGELCLLPQPSETEHYSAAPQDRCTEDASEDPKMGGKHPTGTLQTLQQHLLPCLLLSRPVFLGIRVKHCPGYLSENSAPVTIQAAVSFERQQNKAPRR